MKYLSIPKKLLVKLNALYMVFYAASAGSEICVSSTHRERRERDYTLCFYRIFQKTT